MEDHRKVDGFELPTEVVTDVSNVCGLYSGEECKISGHVMIPEKIFVSKSCHLCYNSFSSESKYYFG